MNIDAVAKFNFPPQYAGEHIECSKDVLFSRQGGESCPFVRVLSHSFHLHDLFTSYIKPYVTAFLKGFNACLFCLGESSSGQNIMLDGHSTELRGIVELSILHIFEVLNQSKSIRNVEETSADVFIQAFLVHNEEIHDLVSDHVETSGGLELCSLIEEGYVIKGLQTLPAATFSSALETYRQAIGRYFSQAYSTNGMSQGEPKGFFFRILYYCNEKDEMSLRTKSSLTFFCLTGIESLVSIINGKAVAGGNLNGMLSLFELTGQLASGLPGKRSTPLYGQSVWTRLLFEELGGSCFTRVLLSLASEPVDDVYALLLRMVSQMVRITNAPIMNDQAALILAARARELNCLSERIAQTGQASEATKITEGRNLRQQLEDLTSRLQRLNEEHTHSTDERVKLSKMWLTSEEDKTIANEKLATAELQIQELRLKNQELQTIGEKAVEASRRAIELKRGNDLLNGFCSDLQVKLRALQKEIVHTRTQNEELSRELVHQISRQKALLTYVKEDGKPNRLDSDFENELRRIETMVGIESKKRESVDAGRGIPAAQNVKRKERSSIIMIPKLSERSLKPDGVIEGKKLTARAEMKSQIVLLTAERDRLKMELEKSHQKLVKFLEMFRNRMAVHMVGISTLTDAAKSSDPKIAGEGAYGLRRYVRHLLADINAAHQVRESQVMQIARKTEAERNSMKDGMKEVMVAYVRLYEQALKLGAETIDPGISPLELVDKATRSMKSGHFHLNLSAKVMAASTDPASKNLGQRLPPLPEEKNPGRNSIVIKPPEQ